MREAQARDETGPWPETTGALGREDTRAGSATTVGADRDGTAPAARRQETRRRDGSAPRCEARQRRGRACSEARAATARRPCPTRQAREACVSRGRRAVTTGLAHGRSHAVQMRDDTPSWNEAGGSPTRRHAVCACDRTPPRAVSAAPPDWRRHGECGQATGRRRATHERASAERSRRRRRRRAARRAAGDTGPLERRHTAPGPRGERPVCTRVARQARRQHAPGHEDGGRAALATAPPRVTQEASLASGQAAACTRDSRRRQRRHRRQTTTRLRLD